MRDEFNSTLQAVNIQKIPSATDALDYVTIVVISAGALAMVAGNLIIWYNRRYLFIRSKSVMLTALSSAGGLLWIFATLVANDHFPRRPGSIFAICAIWTYWLWTLGFSLWLNCLTLRLILLYHVFVRKRDPPKWPYLFLLPLMMPVVVFCVAATTEKEGIEFTQFNSSEGDCKFSHRKGGSPWAYGIISLLVLYFLLFLGFAFQLRKAMALFNEYKLIRQGGILSLFVFLLSLVTIETNAYHKSVGRCYLSAAIASAVFYYFWARNAFVIYNALCDRDAYERAFVTELKRWPSERERKDSPLNFWKMKLQLQHLKENVQEYENQSRQLEQEVNELEREYTWLQQNDSSILRE